MRILVLPLLLATTPAIAQDAADGNFLSFKLGLGAGSKPAYFGADHENVGATGSFEDPALNFGSFGFGGGSDAYGLGVTGSFRYIGARTVADNPELAGLNDIDAALEAGGGFTYTTDTIEVYAVGRAGIGGHEGFVGEIGGDYIMQPTTQTELRLGPRLLFGDDTYASTYFGVDSLSTNFPEIYSAKGGMLSRGLEASISYNFTDNWGVVGTVNYDELMNDAATSPIVQSTDQLGVSVVVTRKITWDF